jgi:hypothetical protein
MVERPEPVLPVELLKHPPSGSEPAPSQARTRGEAGRFYQAAIVAKIAATIAATPCAALIQSISRQTLEGSLPYQEGDHAGAGRKGRRGWRATHERRQLGPWAEKTERIGVPAPDHVPCPARRKAGDQGDVAVEVLRGREASAPAVAAEQGAGVRGGGRARALADCAALINHGRPAHHALVQLVPPIGAGHDHRPAARGGGDLPSTPSNYADPTMTDRLWSCGFGRLALFGQARGGGSRR